MVSERLLALRADRGWDPVRGRATGPLVVVGDPATGTVAAVGPAPADVPDAWDLVDHGDATILPGLIDCHVHLCLDPDTDPVAHAIERSDDELVATMVKAADAALAAGITTVRDLGDRRYLSLALRPGAAHEPVPGPELVLAGPPITPTGGHCWFLGGEADGEDALRSAVRERVDRGVDVVKIMATGGHLTPGTAMHESQYSEVDLRHVVDEAHAAGLPVTAHAHGPSGIADALASGCDGVEHCTFVTEHGVGCDWNTVQRLVERQIVVSATEAWAPSDVPVPEAAATRLDQVWANFARMHELGVRLAISSDGGIHPRKPHDALPHGAVLFADLGLRNHDVLVAVTEVPAAACGLEGRKGRLEVGYDADLLAVEGDPLTDMTALLRPLAVVRAGRIAHRAPAA